MGNKTIWALSTIANDYDQPPYNLEAWWFKKPTFDMLSKVMGIMVDKAKGNSTVGIILGGKSIRYAGADWTLEEIKEGIVGDTKNEG